MTRPRSTARVKLLCAVAVFVCAVFTVGCGGQSSSAGSTVAASGTAPGSGSDPSGDSRETALQRCWQDGDAPRTDYSTIAEYRCADGSVPLGGDLARGAGARVGNVGEGPDGHVVDHYRVPCPSGSVDIYVDPYHCGPGVEAEIDLSNLTPQQLQAMASHMRELETAAPFDPQTRATRRSLVDWLRRTRQVHLEICTAVMEDVVHEGYRHQDLIFSQFVLSMGAAVIELGDGAEQADAVALAAVVGAIRVHQAIVSARGPEAADPRLRALAMSSEAELARHVAGLSARCGHEEPGLIMQTDGVNVWPPSGPECERFVRCCEGEGLVQNGVAVPGTAGLMCLLAAAQPDPDCAGGLEMLRVQSISCPP